MNSLNFKTYFIDKLKTIPNLSKKRFEIEMNVPDVVITCSVVGIVESIKIQIKYTPDKYLLETSSFRNSFLDTDFKTTFEELTSDLYDALYETIKPVGLSVRVYRNDGKLLDWGVTYTNLN